MTSRSDERRIAVPVECTGMSADAVRDLLWDGVTARGSIAELDATLALFQLGAPVSLDDCAEVYRELRERVPVGIPVDTIMVGHDRLAVTVGWRDGAVVRTLVAR